MFGGTRGQPARSVLGPSDPVSENCIVTPYFLSIQRVEYVLSNMKIILLKNYMTTARVNNRYM